MSCAYIKEKNFIIEEIKKAYAMFAKAGPAIINQKSDFDLVTDIDFNIERCLIESIHAAFPSDNIHSEETQSCQSIIDRTWTIDPIDGTCNMTHGIKLYGIQCSLIENNEIVVSSVYLPWFDETYWAVKGCGAYLNENRLTVSKNVLLNNAIISFGDYSHSKNANSSIQHGAIGVLFNQIAKIRMFGAACIDFSFVASSKTDGTVILTSDLWDIAPGVLICKEAGCDVRSFEGTLYKVGDYGVIATADNKLTDLILAAFKR